MNGRDHGGGVDAAAARWGGRREDWLDLSTGINPVPYPIGEVSYQAWTALPDRGAMERLERAARTFWNVPDEAGLVAAPGASAIIARMPGILDGAPEAYIPGPTYNEWSASFMQADWSVSDQEPGANVEVRVHPNNPDGGLAPAPTRAFLDDRDPGVGRSHAIYDESFCDTDPTVSFVRHAGHPRVFIVKSFGKFWGLAGVRLGFLIGPGDAIERMRDMLGPWAVSGPALEIGARALEDLSWAEKTRARLTADYQRLDRLMDKAGAGKGRGTPLFRLYNVDDAEAWQDRLARARIWSRVFPYDRHMLRLGLPGPKDWDRLEAAL